MQSSSADDADDRCEDHHLRRELGAYLTKFGEGRIGSEVEGTTPSPNGATHVSDPSGNNAKRLVVP